MKFDAQHKVQFCNTSLCLCWLYVYFILFYKPSALIILSFYLPSFIRSLVLFPMEFIYFDWNFLLRFWCMLSWLICCLIITSFIIIFKFNVVGMFYDTQDHAMALAFCCIILFPCYLIISNIYPEIFISWHSLNFSLIFIAVFYLTSGPGGNTGYLLFFYSNNNQLGQTHQIWGFS